MSGSHLTKVSRIKSLFNTFVQYKYWTDVKLVESIDELLIMTLKSG